MTKQKRHSAEQYRDGPISPETPLGSTRPGRRVSWFMRSRSESMSGVEPAQSRGPSRLYRRLPTAGATRGESRRRKRASRSSAGILRTLLNQFSPVLSWSALTGPLGTPLGIFPLPRAFSPVPVHFNHAGAGAGAACRGGAAGARPPLHVISSWRARRARHIRSWLVRSFVRGAAPRGSVNGPRASGATSASPKQLQPDRER